ncbi:mycofactocin-coupled SDR family oxidoreductase [Amycolatopsis sp. YIM 10]|uniref:mycofactocin-coupled SDR family oxidoreductase n=1 Tax=Amycolatopsis sp. YIM 10 TaxID=2653857 RepID=UPI0012907857|nr:mycofactocin-coupled SDR family oxidoreductase [Amycolatopsis sp. YIM 10]QFU87499.1 (-)-trans-carveol dehydrogenase [Amycolatopsis sp. YIM 10]
MGRVEGKVVAITGAARGQGRSHAVRLAEEGADIIAIDVCTDLEITEYSLGTQEDLRTTALMVEKTGQRVVTRQADVRDRAALETALSEGVAELGRLDAVVPNAALLPIGAHRSVSAFTDAVDVNVSGVFNTVHAALPHLEGGSSIVVIGSAAGFMPGRDPGPAGPGFAGYKFSKHVLVDYVNNLAVQLAPSGTRVNGVHPTNVDTVMIHNDTMYKTFRPDLDAPTRADADEAFATMPAMPIPYVESIDVSHAVVYLIADESRYVTGAHVRIDGGGLVRDSL